MDPEPLPGMVWELNYVATFESHSTRVANLYHIAASMQSFAASFHCFSVVVRFLGTTCSPAHHNFTNSSWAGLHC